VSTPPSAPIPSPASDLSTVLPIASLLLLLSGGLRRRRFSLLWCGSRDGFGAGDFRGHANTLTVILHTNGNIIGSFTPVEWELRTPNNESDGSNCVKEVASLESFLFTPKKVRRGDLG
jgi:hypothetical protein